jgi:hypothetical protein
LCTLPPNRHADVLCDDIRVGVLDSQKQLLVQLADGLVVFARSPISSIAQHSASLSAATN